MLSLRDLHVHIGKLHILQGVNLEVKPGEAAALQMAVVSRDRLDLQEVGHRSPSFSIRQTRRKPVCRPSSGLVIGPAAASTSLRSVDLSTSFGDVPGRP